MDLYVCLRLKTAINIAFGGAHRTDGWRSQDGSGFTADALHSVMHTVFRFFYRCYIISHIDYGRKSALTHRELRDHIADLDTVRIGVSPLWRLLG